MAAFEVSVRSEAGSILGIHVCGHSACSQPRNGVCFKKSSLWLFISSILASLEKNKSHATFSTQLLFVQSG